LLTGWFSGSWFVRKMRSYHNLYTLCIPSSFSKTVADRCPCQDGRSPISTEGERKCWSECILLTHIIVTFGFIRWSCCCQGDSQSSGKFKQWRFTLIQPDVTFIQCVISYLLLKSNETSVVIVRLESCLNTRFRLSDHIVHYFINLIILTLRCDSRHDYCMCCSKDTPVHTDLEKFIPLRRIQITDAC